LERLFWDYPARSINPDADRDLVVRRVTAEGGWREMRLLRSRVGDQAIRDVMERTEARGLSPQRIRFWQLVLGPARRADAWVRRARESTWARRARRLLRPLREVDVFALGRRLGLGDMLRFYRKKYGVQDVGHVLVALAYFDDADRERTPMLLERQSWPAMKDSIRGWLTGATFGGTDLNPRPRRRPSA
jgi:hypothetical protein